VFLLDGSMMLSPSDLRQGTECEFALLREADVLLGRAAPLSLEDDPILDRVAELGTLHEQAELRRLAALHPGRVVTMSRPDHSAAGYAEGLAATLAALAGDAEVVAQATLFDGSFVGFADFLERTPAGWLVSDTKLARSASVPALLQIAAYAALLAAHDVPVAPVARLVLGSGDVEDYPLAEIVPVYRRRRARLESMLAEHRREVGPVRWGDPRWTACGRCNTCLIEVEEARDLLLVAGMRATTRARLMRAGITTIDALAAGEGPVAEVSAARLDRLRSQARLQLAQEADPTGGVRHEVIDATALRRLPRPSDGDIFFDFEGDPLWRERGSQLWGLEYLFGCVEIDSGEAEFTPLWAHDRAGEKQALRAFVAHVQNRLGRWPDLHIYHYASYEVDALKRLAARHTTCEDEIDGFLRAGLFVDLYAAVRAGVRVSQRSYSIKRLEPLYMGAREAQVRQGDDSIVHYHLFQAARDAGAGERAQELLDGIAAYNREDCVSTWRLRDWLLSLVGVSTAGEAPEAVVEREPSPRRAAQLALEASVRELVEGVRPGERTAEEQAVAMVAASVLFHAREDKPTWWSHYERLALPVDQWRAEQGVGVVVGAPEVIEDWHRPPRARKARRRYRVAVEPLSGVPLAAGTRWAVYARPAPFVANDEHPAHAHVASPSSVTIVAAEVVAEDATVSRNAAAPADAAGLGSWASAGRSQSTYWSLVDAGTSAAAESGRSLSTYWSLVDAGTSAAAESGRSQSTYWSLVDGGMPRARTVQVLTVEELSPAAAGAEPPAAYPVAFVPTGPVPTGAIDAALEQVADRVRAAYPTLPASAGLDVVARRAPRLTGGGPLPRVGDGPQRHVEAVTAALRAMTDSYVAVQGPPGTGKTYVGARVIARLVADGWAVGVCAQSHAAVENVLDAVVAAGVPGTQVAKAAKATADPAWTGLASADGLAGFIAEERAAGRGFVVGGSAWDLCNRKRVEEGALDLVVIDEAGQFSLAKTLAVSTAGTRLLLLGDPAQLPQVTTGTHAEPIDTSALEWLAEGATVLPAERGYFLETTWRMHPRLTDVVSRLSYAGQLGSQTSVTTARGLAGVAPGLHVRLVDHVENAQFSVEEAEVVVDLVRDLVGREWTDPSDAHAPRPLGQGDIVVSTPYNAHVAVVSAALGAAGFEEVRVGTVDRFQGQEAPVAIVTMAASASGDRERQGLRFLLDRHRLNVALSRGQHAAYLVRSVALTDFAPRDAREVLALGAFLALGEAAVDTRLVTARP